MVSTFLGVYLDHVQMVPYTLYKVVETADMSLELGYFISCSLQVHLATDHYGLWRASKLVHHL